MATIENTGVKEYHRRLTSLERIFRWSPYSIVTMVARITGHVSQSMLANAVSRVQRRHPNLRVRIREDDDHVPWFTSEGVGEIPVEVVPRKSDDHWLQVHEGASQVPFDFDARPAIRFILVQSPSVSELIILCHHIICDGMSLAYLARDLMIHLGEPAREVDVLPDPVPIDLENTPEEVSLNPVVRFFMKRINRKWEQDVVFFDQEDYEGINDAYWMHYHPRIMPVELSEAQTQALVARCRQSHVTVNSALTAAFVGAQTVVQGERPFHSSIAIGASLRDRLPSPAGEAMGFYAGGVSLNFKYDGKIGFWDNARKLHGKVSPLYANRTLFKETLTWCHLAPGIMEAMHFKKLGGLVPPHSSKHQRLVAYSHLDDVVLSILKREKMDTLDRVILGTAVTNLTRMDFPRNYGALTLDRLIMNPGGAFPVSQVNLVLGAVTCSGKLSLVIEYVEDNVDDSTMEAIRDKALEFLFDEE
jgi:NRPS condensation-like uncharacterized protein